MAITCYSDVLALMTSKRGRIQHTYRVANNTYLHASQWDFARDIIPTSVFLVLHNTKILKYTLDMVEYDHGGWSTNFTKNRMNDFGPAFLYQEAFQWYFDSPEGRETFYCGIGVDYEGNRVTPDRSSELRLAHLFMKKTVGNYLYAATQQWIRQPHLFLKGPKNLALLSDNENTRSYRFTGRSVQVQNLLWQMEKGVCYLDVLEEALANVGTHHGYALRTMAANDIVVRGSESHHVRTILRLLRKFLYRRLNDDVVYMQVYENAQAGQWLGHRVAEQFG